MSRIRTILPDLATVLLVTCALLITGLVVRRELFPGPPVTAVQEEREVDWKPTPGEGSVIGEAAAPLQIVAFSDFQCPFCAEAKAEIDSIIAREQGRVAVVFRHFPIESIHPHAMAAAIASECAGEQGRFRAYHDALFAAQSEIGRTSWRQYAERAGIPALDQFDQCVKEERFKDRVKRDMEVARKLGINGTPTFIYNGRMVYGMPGVQKLSERVRGEGAKSASR